MTATEWHERRKKKKAEKSAVKMKETISPIQAFQKQQFFLKDEVILKKRVISPPSQPPQDKKG